MEKIPYDYLFFLMFHCLKKFGDRDYIELDAVPDFCMKVLELAKENAKEELDEEIEFEEINIEEELDLFLDTFSDYFYIDDDRVYIYNSVSGKKIEEELADSISNDRQEEIFDIDFQDLDLLSIIHATYMHKEYGRLSSLEKKLEQSYIEYFKNPDPAHSRLLKQFMLIKTGTISILETLPYYYLDSLYLVNVDAMDENNMTYSTSPVDRDLWDEFPHHGDINFGSVFNEVPQYAIFGDGSIAYDKLDNLIQDVYDKKSPHRDPSIDELNRRYEEYHKIQEIIYINFLRNLNEYLKTHDATEELLRTKARLLYYFDNINLCIFDDKNFDSYCETVDKITIKPGDLLKLKDEATFFIGELFYGQDVKHIPQKLLLMKTYYDLSHDEDYLLAFSAFKDLPHFEEYRKIIFGNNMKLAM